MKKTNHEESLERVRALQAEKTQLKKAPVAVSELVEDFDRCVDQAAAKYSRRVGDPMIARFPAIGGGDCGSEVDCDFAISPFIATFFNDELKKKFAKIARENVTGQEISAIDRARGLKKIASDIVASWTAYEQAASAAEEAGAVVTRAPDLPPAIFLEWNEVDKNFNREKFRRLERFAAASDAQNGEYLRDRQVLLEASILPAHQLWKVDDLDAKHRAEQKLAEIETAKKNLSQRMLRESLETKPALRLFATCKEFLKQKGISTDTTDFLVSDLSRADSSREEVKNEG